MNGEPLFFICRENGRFPGSRLPVVLYKEGLDLPLFFKTLYIKRVFTSHQWIPASTGGVPAAPHYHSTAHIALGVAGGSTTIQLGGDNGQKIRLSKGDVLVIPAGAVYHNLGMEDQVQCVVASPYGQIPNRYWGEPGERPSADAHIASVILPAEDPLFGPLDGITPVWASCAQQGRPLLMPSIR